MIEKVRVSIHFGAFFLFAALTVNGYAVSLDNISFSSLAGDRFQVKMELSSPLSDLPFDFKIDEPARVSLDFPGVDLNLDKNSQSIGSGVVQSIQAVQAQGRARVVLHLTRLVPYNIVSEGKNVLITLSAAPASASVASNEGTGVETVGRIEDIDFRRGAAGEGKIIVQLSDPSIAVNFGREGKKIIVNFVGAQLPAQLNRTLDVADFATPVKEVDTVVADNSVQMAITMMTEQYEHIAYQVQKNYTIEFKPVTKEEQDEAKKDRFDYTGDRLSLNFQDIEVRAVLQLLADFNGFNLVANDRVGGNITMRLNNVPWDQALDIILNTQGLGMRQYGNVWMIAPAEDIIARERLELEASKQVEELAPLRTELIQVNYANAEDIAELIQSEGSSLLSERGAVSIDTRTNILIVKDIADSLTSIRRLVEDIDIPVRQVLIESRIVNASESFAKDIGVRFGYSKRGETKGKTFFVGGANEGNVRYGTEDNPLNTSFHTDNRENLMVSLPAGNPAAGGIRLAAGKFGSYLLQLELTALIAEGRGENIASPRVITSNQTEAIIKEGVQIPYQQATSSGATATEFKDATLSLQVTPQITPDDRILMNLIVTQDTQGAAVSGGVPTIDTRSLSTQVLVDDGETVVLGGVYTQTDNKTVNRIPFFSDIPYLRALFKNTDINKEKRELLIFVTPKILKEQAKI